MNAICEKRYVLYQHFHNGMALIFSSSLKLIFSSGLGFELFAANVFFIFKHISLVLQMYVSCHNTVFGRVYD